MSNVDDYDLSIESLQTSPDWKEQECLVANKFSVERAHTLRRLAVPPKDFDIFLVNATDTVARNVCDQYECKTFDEVRAKEFARQKALRPEWSDSQLRVCVRSPLNVGFRATLHYEDVSQMRKTGELMSTRGYTKDLFYSYYPGKQFDAEQFSQSAPPLVEELRAWIDAQAPARLDFLPKATGEPHARERRTVVSRDYMPHMRMRYNAEDTGKPELSGFNFTLYLDAPLIDTRVQVVLRDDGILFEGGEHRATCGVAIDIRAQSQNPTLEPLVEQLSSVIRSQYEVLTCIESSSVQGHYSR